MTGTPSHFGGGNLKFQGDAIITADVKVKEDEKDTEQQLEGSAGKTATEWTCKGGSGSLGLLPTYTVRIQDAGNGTCKVTIVPPLRWRDVNLRLAVQLAYAITRQDGKFSDPPLENNDPVEHFPVTKAVVMGAVCKPDPKFTMAAGGVCAGVDGGAGAGKEKVDAKPEAGKEGDADVSSHSGSKGD